MIGFRLFLPAILLLLIGCSSTRNVTITSEPAGAMIQVNGRNVGSSPVEVPVDKNQSPIIVIRAVKQGYLPEQITLKAESRDWTEGHLNVVLMEDEAYRVTTTSDATNNWLRVQVDATLDPDGAWQRLVDSVTSRYTSLEQLDDRSGYLRTIYERRRFSGKDRGFEVRTRFISSLSQRNPLVYKFRIEAETTDSRGEWVPYDRVFKEDAALIEELTNRLGVK